MGADSTQARDWDELVALRPALRAFLVKRAPAPDVEDLLQEVMLRIHQRGDTAPIGNLEGYLFQTAASVLADYGRRRQVRRADAHQAFDEQAHPIEESTPARVLEGREKIGRLMAALQALDEATRDVFVMHRFEEMTYPEIAAALGVSLSTVEKRIMKALRHFAAWDLP
jgi:RNA polymerase sigma-70 factor (ECF subfamily)